MYFALLLYYTSTFGEADALWPQIVLFINSFIVVLFIVFGFICIILRLTPDAGVIEDLFDLINEEYLKTLPEYKAKTREWDIIDECIDTETDLEYWS